MKKIFKTVTIVAGLLALLLVTFGALAQDQEAFVANNESDTGSALQTNAFLSKSVDSSNENIVPFACGLTNCAYLPLLEAPSTLNQGKVFHKSVCSAAESVADVPNGGSIALSNGQRLLAFGALAEGYRGSSYETYFVINGEELRNLDSSGTILSDSEPIFSTSLTFGQPGLGCQNVLPTGTYTVRFLIDGKLVTQYSVVIN